MAEMLYTDENKAHLKKKNVIISNQGQKKNFKTVFFTTPVFSLD